MSDDERVLRCAYEDAALWEVAVELGDREDARATVRRLIDDGLLELYVESGWPRLRRETVAPERRDGVLERQATWDVPAGTLHAPTVGIALTERGRLALRLPREHE